METNNFDFLSVRATVVSVVSFATIIWSRHATGSLSNWNTGCCVTRLNNDCEGDYSERGTGAFNFCSEVFRQ